MITRYLSRLSAMTVAAVVLASVPASAGDDWFRSCYFRADVGYAWGADDDARASTPGAAVGPLTEVTYDKDSAVGEIGLGCGRSHYVAAHGGSLKDEPKSMPVAGPGLRADITLGWRGEREFRGNPPTPPLIIDPVLAKFDTFTGLFNVYLDFGSWHGIAPYVGAGVGFAVHDLGDAVFTNGAVVRVNGGRSTELAWALMAGISTDIGHGLKLDVGYRYIDLGDVSWSDAVGHSLFIDDLSAHELRAGIRIPLHR